MAVRTVIIGGKRRFNVEFEIRGHRVFRRLPAGATKEQAHQLETRLKHEFIDQAIIGKKPDVSLHAVIRTWLEESVSGRKSEAHTISHALRVIKATDASLRLADVRDAAEALRTTADLAPATINRRLCVLKAAAKWAWKVKQWTAHNLSPFVALLGGEESRDRVIDAKAIGRLIRAMETREGRAFVALGAYALMRQSEVMRLDQEALARGGIRILDWDAKIRTVHVVAQLKPHLKAVPLTRHKRTLYAEFEAARAKLKLEDFVYHDLRRSGATILLNRGVRLEVVSAILGHKDLETTRKIYAHVLPATVRRDMDKGFRAHRHSHRGKPKTRVST